MAHRVFTEVGGATKTVLTECGNAILISDILEENVISVLTTEDKI